MQLNLKNFEEKQEKCGEEKTSRCVSKSAKNAGSNLCFSASLAIVKALYLI